MTAVGLGCLKVTCGAKYPLRSRRWGPKWHQRKLFGWAVTMNYIEYGSNPEVNVFGGSYIDYFLYSYECNVCAIAVSL